MKYSDKLKDPRWQRKRLEIMQRDDFCCMSCSRKDLTLNVHHKEYHGNPWDAPNESLETLCERCHKRRRDVNASFLSLSTSDALCLSSILDMGLATGQLYEIEKSLTTQFGYDLLMVSK
jgi:hypothetical protein